MDGKLFYSLLNKTINFLNGGRTFFFLRQTIFLCRFFFWGQKFAKEIISPPLLRVSYKINKNYKKNFFFKRDVGDGNGDGNGGDIHT